jgi:hypothetical protein
MAVSPRLKRMFLIDVKGLYRKNPWVVKRKPERCDLFYVFAFVPTGETNQFFVMTQKRVNKLIQDELTRLKRPADYKMTGVTWKLVTTYEDAWDTLPE